MAGQFRARKSIDRLIADSELPQFRLNKSLGPWSMIALGIGAIIGAGIYTLPGVAAVGKHYQVSSVLHQPILDLLWQLLHGLPLGSGVHASAPAGPAIALSFLLLAVICIVTGLCFAELATLMPLAGSVYTYSYAAFGELAAWMTGWTLTLEYGLSSIVLAGALSSELKTGPVTSHVLALPSQWWMPAWAEGAWTGGYFNVPAFVIILATTLLLAWGLRIFSKATMLMVLLKCAAILVFVVVGSTLVHPANWHPFAPGGMKGVLAGGTMLFYTFIGFDYVSVAAEEARNPERSVPFGIVGSIVISALLYIAVALVLLGMMPYTEFGSGAADSTVPALYALGRFGANPIYLRMVGSGMVIGLLSLVFVSQYSQTRIWYAMSRDGLLPEVFSSLHPKKKIPHWCIWIGGAAMALLAGLIGIGEAGDVVINGALVAFAVVPICVIYFRKTQPERPRRIKVPWAPWLPLVSLAATLVMMASLPLISWIRFAGWLAIGLVIYLGYGRRHSTLAAR